MGAGAVWQRERVIGLNGNLTRYIYEQDQRRVAGTAFDALTGEDFRQAYLAGIHYSGKASRTGAAALNAASDREPGAYSAVFRRAQPNGHLLHRPHTLPP